PPRSRRPPSSPNGSLCVSETTPRLPPRALLIVPGPVVTDDASQIVRNFFPEFLDSSWAGMYHDSVQNITNAGGGGAGPLPFAGRGVSAVRAARPPARSRLTMDAR